MFKEQRPNPCLDKDISRGALSITSMLALIRKLSRKFVNLSVGINLQVDR